MKRLLSIFLILILFAAGGCYWLYQNVKPASSSTVFSDFVISKGETAGTVANNLQSAGLIKSALAFRIYIRVTDQSGKIETGEFKLSPSMSLLQIIDQLQRGPIEIWVTIPEGLRREEIAAKFAIAFGKNQSFVNDFLTTSKGEEGYLFPDTYLFPKDVTATAVVKKMLATFTNKTSSLNLTKDQVIIASILERETKTDEERPVVAGIIINRLSAGMPLQVDATVQYAVGTSKDWWPILSLEDLKINSPFNTYKFAGLPPNPISNPGLSSLSAASKPKASDYLYYIHDTSGQIHYATTLAEHNANVKRYLGK